MVTQARLAKFREVAAQRFGNIVLVLEDVADPHNIEAIVRSADAFGVQNIYVIFEQTEPFNPRNIGKATSGSANKWVDFYIYQSTQECLMALKKQEFSLVATVLDVTAHDVYETAWPARSALLVGNEHHGLSAAAVKLADQKIYIPMNGMVQSLNVSVATAICLSEFYRTYRSKKSFFIDESAQQKLVEDFLQR